MALIAANQSLHLTCRGLNSLPPSFLNHYTAVAHFSRQKTPCLICQSAATEFTGSIKVPWHCKISGKITWVHVCPQICYLGGKKPLTNRILLNLYLQRNSQKKRAVDVHLGPDLPGFLNLEQNSQREAWPGWQVGQQDALVVARALCKVCGSVLCWLEHSEPVTEGLRASISSLLLREQSPAKR